MKKTLIILMALLILSVGAFAENEESDMNRRILITVNGITRTATLADNPSADAFRILLQTGDVTVEMHDYGGFEKVGPLGTGIIRSDTYIMTAPGDIILYLGNRITIYYDVNSWEFTLLGHVDDATEENMREFLGDGDPAVTFSLLTE